jgi:hypothetical protein
MITFSAAEALRRQGYAPVPVPFGDRSPPGPWAVYQLLTASENKNDGIGILTTCPPGRGLGAAILLPRDTFVCALDVDVRNRRIAAEIDAVIDSHLRWTNGSTASPRRVASDGATLRVFALEGEPFSNVFTCRYRFPDDRGSAYTFRPHKVEVISVNGYFVASGTDDADRPYVWQGGDLLSVPRSALPVLNASTARELIDAVEDALVHHGGKRV